MSALDHTTISFIGCGIMGEAMVAGILNRGLTEPRSITASHPRADRRDELQSRYGIAVTASNPEAASAHDIVVLTVKPQVLPRVLAELRGCTRPSQLVLSIVAGATIETIQRWLGTPAVVRAMPNTPAQIGEGMTVWTATEDTEAQQRRQAQSILAALGRELYVDDENFLDMATAISGTGPSYFFLVMEALVDAAVHLGFSRRVALELVTQTMLGSVLYARQSRKHPAELRNQVTSPGGTSAEALYQLEKGTVRTVFSKAVWAAYQRSRQLGRAGQDDSPREL